jgi:hypothetical protein
MKDRCLVRRQRQCLFESALLAETMHDVVFPDWGRSTVIGECAPPRLEM